MPDSICSGAAPIGVWAWSAIGEAALEGYKARFGRRFRRVGPYVKLSQLGAVACTEGLDDAARAQMGPGPLGIFLGSGLGNTRDVSTLGHAIFSLERSRCSPMMFAGCVGNTAAFYVATALGADGPNVTVSQEEVSFEAALQAAMLRVRAGVIPRALVGGVDVCTDSPEERERLGAVGVPGTVAPAAAFVLLGPAEGAPAVITDVWMGVFEELWEGTSQQARVYPGWRLEAVPERFDSAPREVRINPIATGLRLVDVLTGSQRGECALVQRTAGGLGARILLRC